LREGVDDPQQAQVLGSIFSVKSSLFRLRASGVANVDSEGEGLGGVGQTLSVLVQRRVDSRFDHPDREGLGWTFRPLDWQKEGGAQLLEPSDEESDEFGSTDRDGDLYGFEEAFDEFDDSFLNR
jgi:hypothetical protein